MTSLQLDEAVSPVAKQGHWMLSTEELNLGGAFAFLLSLILLQCFICNHSRSQIVKTLGI